MGLERAHILTLCHIYDILLSRDNSGKIKNPIDKGKPFERMGHKALEPKSPEDLWLSAAKREMVEVLK